MAIYPTEAEARDAVSPEEMEDRIDGLALYHKVKTVASLAFGDLPDGSQLVVMAAWLEFASVAGQYGITLDGALNLKRDASPTELANAALSEWRNEEYARRQSE